MIVGFVSRASVPSPCCAAVQANKDLPPASTAYSSCSFEHTAQVHTATASSSQNMLMQGMGAGPIAACIYSTQSRAEDSAQLQEMEVRVTANGYQGLPQLLPSASDAPCSEPGCRGAWVPFDDVVILWGWRREGPPLMDLLSAYWVHSTIIYVFGVHVDNHCPSSSTSATYLRSYSTYAFPPLHATGDDAVAAVEDAGAGGSADVAASLQGRAGLSTADNPTGARCGAGAERGGCAPWFLAGQA